MIWVPATGDSDAQLLTVDTFTVGVVRYNSTNKKFMATTNKHYLGYYMTLLNAQKAVEAKYVAEQKALGKTV